MGLLLNYLAAFKVDFIIRLTGPFYKAFASVVIPSAIGCKYKQLN